MTTMFLNFTKTLTLPLALSVLGASALVGCEDDVELRGSVELYAWGEEYVEEGIPADEFDDGWSVSFDRFVVTVKNVVIAGEAFEDPLPVDLAKASEGGDEGFGHLLGEHSAPAGTHANSEYTITKLQIAGSATLDDVTKTFDWTIEAPTRYHHCDTTTTVESGESTSFQITVHSDHLFVDSLASNDPGLIFQPWADADTDGDGVITRAELEAAEVLDIDVGSDGTIDTLWKVLVHASQTVGHADGEEHCDASAL